MNLDNILKEKGIMQIHLAKKLNVTKQTITNWCKGYTSPTLDQAQKLKEVLNLNSIDDLIKSSPKDK